MNNISQNHGVPKNTAIGLWLIFVAALVFAMAIIGAITRLTNSGLSMVDWRPLLGVVPPLTPAEWQASFDAYRLYPEYQLLNRGMDLSEYKYIFYWEWFHRSFGHLLAVFFLGGIIWFWLKKQLTRTKLVQLLLIFALGGLQALVGWFMVYSGLQNRPSVSHYKLALHLTVATFIFALLLWQAYGFLQPRLRELRTDIPRFAVFAVRFLTGWLIVLMIWGAFVAGLDAGFVYNSFPLMDGQFVPEAYNMLQPFWLNFLENTAMVQFVHRWLAVSLVVLLLALCWYGRAWPADLRLTLYAVAALGFVQMLLGIFTLLWHVPVALGAAHQGGALLLLSAMLLLNYRLRPANLQKT